LSSSRQVRPRRASDGSMGSRAEVAAAAAVVVAVTMAPPTKPLPEPIDVDQGRERATPRKAAAVTRPVGLRLAGGMDFASLPGPSFGLELAAPIVFGASRVEIEASGWLPRDASAMSPVNAGARLFLFAGGARYCRSFVLRALDLAPCAGSKQAR
jgi:hypothetical protein